MTQITCVCKKRWDKIKIERKKKEVDKRNQTSYMQLAHIIENRGFSFCTLMFTKFYLVYNMKTNKCSRNLNN